VTRTDRRFDEPAQPNLYRIWEAAGLSMEASVENRDHHAYAYARWIKKHVEELLYEDLWEAMKWQNQRRWRNGSRRARKA
jgi:hypothetical protein